MVLKAAGCLASYDKDDNVAENVDLIAEYLQQESNESAHLVALQIVDVLTHLPLHVPVICSSLCKIHGNANGMLSLVVDSLCDELVAAITSEDVYKSKLILRSLCILASGMCINWNGLLSVFQELLTVCQNNYEIIDDRSLQFSMKGIISYYCLVSSVPWLTDCLKRDINNQANASFWSDLQSFISLVLEKYQSPFGFGRKQMIFNADFSFSQELQFLSSFRDSSCWDNILQSSEFAGNLLADVMKDPVNFCLPSCMSNFWSKTQEIDMSSHVFCDLPSSFSFSWHRILNSSSFGQVWEDASSGMILPSYSRMPFIVPRFPVFEKSSLADQEIFPTCFDLSFAERHIFGEYCQELFYFFDPVVHIDGCRSGSIETMVIQLLSLERLFFSTSSFFGALDMSSSSWDTTLNRSFGAEYLILENLLQWLAINPPNSSFQFGVAKSILQLCKIDFYPAALVRGLVSIYDIVSVLDGQVLIEYGNFLCFFIQNASGTGNYGYPLNFPFLGTWIQELLEMEQVESLNSLPTTSAVLFLRGITDRLSRNCRINEVKTILPAVAAQEWCDTMDTTLHFLLESSSTNAEADRVMNPQDITVQFNLLRDLLAKKSLVSSIEEFLEQLPSSLQFPDSFAPVMHCLSKDATDLEKETVECLLLFHALLTDNTGISSWYSPISSSYVNILRSYRSQEAQNVSFHLCLNNNAILPSIIPYDHFDWLYY